MIYLIILFLLLVVVLLGCTAVWPTPIPMTPTMTAVPTAVAPSPTAAMMSQCGTIRRTVQVLALGDSYTIGEDVAVADRWPNQLARQLQAKGVTVAAPQIIAKTGWTTAELQQGLETAVVSAPYDMVTLLIGVNNQYRGLAVADYQPEFVALLRQAVELAGGDAERVIVLSIPDWGVMPFAGRRNVAQIAAEIDAFNEVNRAETAVVGAHYVDVTAISRQATVDNGYIAGDGLHPSGAQYADWVAQVLPVACRILQAAN